jgi:integrase
MSVYRPRDKNGRYKSPYWHFDFEVTLPSGEHRRFSGSTGLIKKKDAQDFETEKRRLVALGTGPGALTINEACWRLWAELGREFKGAREKARHLETIRRLLGRDTRIVDISKQMIADAIRTRSAEPIMRYVRRDPTSHGGALVPKQIGLPSGATINRSFIKPLKALLRRAESHWDVPISSSKFPWRDWLYPEQAKPGRELAASEEQRLWEVVRADYHPLIWFMANNGVRVGGALSMRKSRTNLERRETQILRKTKARGEHWAKIKLSSAAVAVIATEMARTNRNEIWTYEVQRGADKGKRVPITYAALRRVTDTMFRRAGIKDFRRHDLRHDFGSKLLRATRNLKLVQEKLHHSSVAVTAKFYAHITNDEIVEGTELVEALRASRNGTGNAPATPVKRRKKT